MLNRALMYSWGADGGDEDRDHDQDEPDQDEGVAENVNHDQHSGMLVGVDIPEC